MFFLLIGFRPLNCMESVNLWLYGATAFYWVMTFLSRAVANSLGTQIEL